MIIGDGPEKDMLKKKVEHYGIAPSIKFIDAIVDTRLYLGITNIFVLSSVQEGLGLSLIEAMACNRPVIATEVGGINTLIKNEETGLLVKPESPEALKAEYGYEKGQE